MKTWTATDTNKPVWNLVYLHIAAANSVPVGKWVNRNDRIGHPACVGGYETGTHLHFVRKYNGEWIPADGPIPFVLSGWTVHAGSQPAVTVSVPAT